MKTFEEIIGDRKLHELTDDEINQIVKEMTPDQLTKFDQSLKKEIRSRKKPPTKKRQENVDEFNKALFG
jgi:Mg/Co/Ni transporter MgtE